MRRRDDKKRRKLSGLLPQNGINILEGTGPSNETARGRARYVPDELIEQILEAGRAAPIGCNLDVVRFVVIRDPEKAKMI